MSTKQTIKTISSMPVSDSVRNVEPKTVAAVILVVLMMVLWGRVLLRSKTGPASVQAATTVTAEKTEAENVDSEVKIQAVSLAVIPEKHETIAADYFRADRCSMWGTNQTSSATSSVQSKGNHRILEELSRAFALEALIKDADGNIIKACINGTLVGVGSFLQVHVQNETYSVQVVSIEPSRVQLGWRDYKIALEMPNQKGDW